MKSWRAVLQSGAVQTGEENSFTGGKPKLPPGMEIPKCTLCGRELTFFFQIAFPEGHPWAGKSMAVFDCTDTWHGDFCIPELPKGPSLNKIDITADFLSQHQRTFRVLTFDTEAGAVVEGYQDRILFQPLDITPEGKTDRSWDFVLGGRPVWIMGKPEKPASIAGVKKPLLLTQVRENFRFPIHPDAPKAADPFTPSGRSPFPWYSLFTGNRVYFWGAADGGREWIYVSVQSP